MKILFVDQYSEVGGAQRVLIELVEAVEKRGWRAEAALPGGGPLLEQLRSRHIEAHEIPCGPYRSGDKGAADLVRFALDLRRQLRILHDLVNRGGFDLIYVNGGRLLAAASIAARGAAPVLFHMHYPIHQAWAARLAAWSVRRSDATVVACSKSVAQSLARYIQSREMHVIGNGTRELRFREREFGGQKGWRIGLVGRISPQKGQLEFVEAARSIAGELPTARFVICGAPLFGADEYFRQVKALAEGLPVDFLGWRDDVAGVLAELDLLVMPSKEEGTPLVLLEAFSAGVPVVAFPAGGISEVITDGETGFLVMEASAKALAGKIRDVLQGDPAILQKIAVQARRRWEASYTLAGHQNRVMELLERVVSDWQAKRGREPQPTHK